MAKSDNTWIWLALAAGGLYYFSKGSNAQAAQVSTVPAAALPTVQEAVVTQATQQAATKMAATLMSSPVGSAPPLPRPVRKKPVAIPAKVNAVPLDAFLGESDVTDDPAYNSRLRESTVFDDVAYNSNLGESALETSDSVEGFRRNEHNRRFSRVSNIRPIRRVIPT